MSTIRLRTGCAAACLLLASSSASAALLDVVLSTRIGASDFFINTDSVFGESPADQVFSLTVRVDTTAIPPDMANAGDPTGSDVFLHDVWGYNAVSATASFGTKNWDSADILTLDFGDGITPSKLFVDTELTAGATPGLASFRMEDADGFVLFGTRACGGGFCQVLEDFQIRDFNGGVLDPSNDYIFTTNYSVEVRAVDAVEPGALALLGAGLLGLAGARRRQRRD